MSKIKILCDAMSDLPEGVIGKYDIEVIPTSILLEGKEYKAGLDITSKEFCHMLRNTESMPTTAQVPYLTYKEVFERNLKDNDKIIYLAGSSAASGTSQTARLVASDIEGEIHIIDTYNLSIGGGIVVLEAIKMVEEGKTVEEVVQRIEGIKSKVRVFFSVGTLDYLQKGGRISSVKATIGTILNICPILNIEEGLVKQKGQVRGKNRVIPELINSLRESVGEDFSDKIVYIGCGDEFAQREKLIKKVESELSPKRIEIFEVGSCIVSHSGPSVLAISCIKE